jgi:hypothetical protein
MPYETVGRLRVVTARSLAVGVAMRTRQGRSPNPPDQPTED